MDVESLLICNIYAPSSHCPQLNIYTLFIFIILRKQVVSPLQRNLIIKSTDLSQILVLGSIKLQTENLIKLIVCLSHTLPLDFDAPNITAPNDVLINCGDSLSPNIRGNPDISDIQDPSPSVTYEDKDGSDCFIIRSWIATDHAGNVAKKEQKLTIISVSPINVCKILFDTPKVHLRSSQPAMVEYFLKKSNKRCLRGS